MIKYCIECEQEVITGWNEEINHMLRDALGEDMGDCSGPFASVAPPEYSEQYWEYVLAQDYPVECDPSCRS